MNEDRIRRHQDYQQFHINIYVSMASAMVAGAVLVKKSDRSVELWPLSIVIVFLLVAGMCGGMVLAKLSRASDYENFTKERIGFRAPPMKEEYPRLLPETWEIYEHLFFWLAMLTFAAFGIYAVIR